MAHPNLHLSLFPTAYNTKVHGDVVYTATKYYPPDVVTGWIQQLEKRLQFLGVKLEWEYTEDRRVQVKTLSDPENVIDEMTIGGKSLEAYALHYAQTH